MIHKDDRWLFIFLAVMSALFIAAIVAQWIGFRHGRELRRNAPPTISEVAAYGFKGSLP